MTESTKLYGSALVHAKEILDFILVAQQAPTLKDLDEGLAISKPTILKILTTLEYLKFVYRDETDKTYFIGTALIGYSQKAMNDLDITRIAEPILTGLRDVTSETVHLGIEEYNEVTFVEKIEGNQSVALQSRVGGSLPMYCSSMGKAILSVKSPSELEQYVEQTPLIAKTNRTITDKATLLAEVAKTRQRGYSIDDCENEDDVMCIGAVIEKNHHVFGAFSVSAPEYRMTDDRRAQITNLVLEAKAKILAQV